MKSEVSAKPGIGSSPARTAIVVLGVGRSGTSALTRVLNLLGAALPRDLVPPDPENERGFWEPASTPAMQDGILASLGTSSLNSFDLIPDEWFETAQAAAHVRAIKAFIAREYAEAPLIAIKDPRISLLFPLWRRALDELGIVCKPILAVRNPLEIAHSMCRLGGRNLSNDAARFDESGLLTVRFNICAERWSRSLPRSFASYDSLLTDWRSLARRLGTELDIVWPNWNAASEAEIEAFLDAKQRHHRLGENPARRGGLWSQWIDPVYRALLAACDWRIVDTASFDQIRKAYLQAESIFGRSSMAKGQASADPLALPLEDEIQRLRAPGAAQDQESKSSDQLKTL